MDTIKQDEILNEINKYGVFWFTPEIWDTHGKAVEELVKMGLINRLSDEGYKEFNTDYAYVAKDNPSKIEYVRTHGNTYELKATK